jgi:hypothetical protein
MARYTRKDLDAALVEINTTVTSGRHLEAQSRNGYTGLDEYMGNKCVRNIQCGSPRECAFAAYEWALDQNK